MKTYDADQVSVAIAGIPIDGGYADGEFVRIENNEDAFTMVVGTDGKVTRSKTNNHTATVTLILMQSATANAALSALYNIDINAPNGAGIGPLLIADQGGTALYTAAKCWIQKPPNVSFDRAATPREWVIAVEKLIRLDGGN